MMHGHTNMKCRSFCITKCFCWIINCLIISRSIIIIIIIIIIRVRHFLAKVIEKIKTRILCSATFSESRTI